MGGRTCRAARWRQPLWRRDTMSVSTRIAIGAVDDPSRHDGGVGRAVLDRLREGAPEWPFPPGTVLAECHDLRALLEHVTARSTGSSRGEATGACAGRCDRAGRAIRYTAHLVPSDLAICGYWPRPAHPRTDDCGRGRTAPLEGLNALARCRRRNSGPGAAEAAATRVRTRLHVASGARAPTGRIGRGADGRFRGHGFPMTGRSRGVRVKGRAEGNRASATTAYGCPDASARPIRLSPATAQGEGRGGEP